jgi:hypothetical protein
VPRRSPWLAVVGDEGGLTKPGARSAKDRPVAAKPRLGRAKTDRVRRLADSRGSPIRRCSPACRGMRNAGQGWRIYPSVGVQSTMPFVVLMAPGRR